MADFSAWGPLELKITLGQIITALITAGAAVWVGHKIQRRNASERAIKDLLVKLCGDSLGALNTLADSIETFCPKGGTPLDESARNRLMRGIQVFSNSTHCIDVAFKQCLVESTDDSLRALKDGREDLRAQITEPLVTARTIDDAQLRQIQGAVLKNREALIRLELDFIKRNSFS